MDCDGPMKTSTSGANENRAGADVGFVPIEELARALRNHPFTKDFPETSIVRLASLARKVSFQEDQIIFREGERSRHFYLLLTGSVCVEISTAVFAVCIQALGPGEVFGWSTLVDHSHTLFQVRAREASSALCFAGAQLLEACRQDSELGREIFSRLLAVAAKRVAASEVRLAEFCGVADCGVTSRRGNCLTARQR